MATDKNRDEEADIAGASTDEHITGKPETGKFLTDEPPVSTTPATGSSNKGINTTEANRQD